MTGYEGQVVLNYKLSKKLGEGGFGVVYLAEQVALGRRAACKILHPEYARNPGLVDRFFREARAVCEIGHRTIVTIENFGTLPTGEPFYLMEYFPGSSLRELVETCLLSSAQLVAVFDPIAEALAAAHGKGIVHRDLKPDNIMVRLDGGEIADVRLLDFGIAKLLDTDAASSMTGDALGTPAFMAPEQALDAKGVDVRADVYAFAATIYAALSGHAPFEGGATAAVLIRVQLEAAPPLQAYRPEVTHELDAVIRRCLAKSRDERPPTIAQAWAEIRDAVGRTQLAPVMVAPSSTSVAVTEPPDAPPVDAAPPTANGRGARAPVSPASPPPPSARAAPGATGDLDVAIERRPRRAGLVIGGVLILGIATTVAVFASRSPRGSDPTPLASASGTAEGGVATEPPRDAQLAVDAATAAASIDVTVAAASHDAPAPPDAAPPDAAPPDAAGRPTGPGEVVPKPSKPLAAAEIDAKVQGAMKALRACGGREPFSGSGPRPRQDLTLTITVEREGAVPRPNVAVTGTHSPEVLACLTDVIARWRFRRIPERFTFTASVVTGGGGEAAPEPRCDAASFQRVIDQGTVPEAAIDRALARLNTCKQAFDPASFEQLQRALLGKRL